MATLDFKKPHGRTHIGTIYLGGIFNDGPGIELSPTKHGGWVIKRIPPRQPAFEQFGAVALLVSQAGSVKSRQLKARLIEVATQIASEALGAPVEIRL